MAITINVKINCRHCHGKGLIIGPMRALKWGDPSIRVPDERDCEACDGKGSTTESVTLDDAALQQIAHAISAMSQTATSTRARR